MKRIAFAVVTATLVLAGIAASNGRADADERVGNAALGAVSGAVVLGPIGAVAGAAIGYTAGPSIARGLGFKKSTPRHRSRAKRARKSAAKHASAPVHAPAPPPRPRHVRSDIPPAQTLE